MQHICSLLQFLSAVLLLLLMTILPGMVFEGKGRQGKRKAHRNICSGSSRT